MDVNCDKQTPPPAPAHCQRHLLAWLDALLGAGSYQLEALSGDASFRRYFRLRYRGQIRIVMDASPERESCAAFVDIAGRLEGAGVKVPAIIEQDITQGLMLLGDLGDVHYLQSLDDSSAEMLYRAALQTLYTMQNGVERKNLPHYDVDLLTGEMNLFTHWLLEKHLQLDLSAVEREMLAGVFTLLVNAATEQPQVFVHRDYHSRNLMFDASEPDAPGVLDFQDAVLGPYTYDPVSLLKDCYIKWPRPRINAWAQCFFAHQTHYFPGIEPRVFMRWFDLMGVQRHLKAAGIFARLCHRDGKATYLADIPRTLSYVFDLDGEYPELAGLITLLTTRVLPALEAD